jgi:predicted acyltransferase (DUF342 family)
LGDASFNGNVNVNSLFINGISYSQTISNINNFVADVSINNRLFVGSDASLNARLTVLGDVSFNNRLFVGSDASLNARLAVLGDVSFNNRLFIGSDVSLNARLAVLGDVSLNNRLFVRSDASLNARLAVLGDVSFNNRLFIGSDVSLNARLAVLGDVSFNNRLFIGSDASLNANLTVIGDVSFNSRMLLVGDASFNNRLFVGSDVSLNARLAVLGDVSLNNRLFVRSDVSFNARLAVLGDASFNNRLFVGSDVSLNSRLAVLSDVSFNNRLFVGSDVSLNSRLAVLSDVSLNNRLFVGSDVSFNSRLAVLSDVSLNNRLFVGSDVSLNARLAVLGDVSLNSRLAVNGDASFNGPTGIQVINRVTAASFNATSDYRVKTNVIPLDTSFTIDKIVPVTYYNTISRRADIGVIAHELQEIYPCLVSGKKDGETLQSVNYNGITGLLVKEVKELKLKSDFILTDSITGNFITTKPINIHYSPALIETVTQLGGQIIGTYNPFSYRTPIAATPMYTILLTPGVWLVESNISYSTTDLFDNNEIVSLSTTTTLNPNNIILTPIVLEDGHSRYQRIMGTFRITEPTTVYTLFQASTSKSNLYSTITTSQCSCIATRIA